MNPRGSARVLAAAVCVGWGLAVSAQAAGEAATTEAWLRLLTLQDHNTRVVLLGSWLLGTAAGLVGTFLLLRKRALVGDAISHATLPGIAAAFLVMTAWGGTGKHLGWLLFGGLISGLLGMGLMTLIRSQTRLKEDAALGIVLSVFFGIGLSLLGVIQRMPTGHAAGLESFVLGKTASMLAADAQLIAVAAAVILCCCAACFKEFTLLCFDEEFAAAQGLSVAWLDALMMALVVGITVIGLQAVGLILMLALLVIPAASARFWTRRMALMLPLAGFLGGAACLTGAAVSAILPHMPAGAIMVLCGTVVFLVSFVLGRERGAWTRWSEQRQLRERTGLQHLLRAVYEWLEACYPHAIQQAVEGSPPVPWQALQAARSWSPARLQHVVDAAERGGQVLRTSEGSVQLTRPGLARARRVVRNHRLWELFLITHADIAPSHVDRDADMVEHVLGARMVRELEQLLERQRPAAWIPPSPHLVAAREGRDLAPNGNGP